MRDRCVRIYESRADRANARMMCPKCGLAASRHPETWDCIRDLCDLLATSSRQVHAAGRMNIIAGIRDVMAEHVEGRFARRER